MELKMNTYSVYIKINNSDYIIAVNSSDFLNDTTGWIEIDSGYGDKYHHAKGNYFPKCLLTDGGAYRYKLVGEKAVECTEDEINQQEEANNIPITNPSTLEDRVSILENKVDKTIAEYEESLIELGVEV